MKSTDKMTLDDLRNKYEGHVYLRFRNSKQFDDFLVKAEGEGFRFGEHLPSEYLGRYHDMIALIENKQLSFCSTFSRMAYQCGGENVHRVDYAKFSSGKADFII